MNILKYLKSEIQTFGKYEKIFFPLIIIFILSISFYMKDDKIALISAICGVSYSILAGKGKFYCYFFGIMSTFCYGYISFKNTIYGNVLLNLGYYLPMQILGIFSWKKNLKQDGTEIVKTKLPLKTQIIYLSLTLLVTIATYFVIKAMGDKYPLVDSITTVFSILGMYLTVKRCIEQWYAWIIVNGLSVLMWIFAYLNGSKCFATILMWLVYFILAFYFLNSWRKEKVFAGEIEKS